MARSAGTFLGLGVRGATSRICAAWDVRLSDMPPLSGDPSIVAHSTVAGVARQRARRILVVLASALVATVAVSPGTAVGAVRASDPAASSASVTTLAATAQAKPRRAVIVVGPTGGQTAEYLREARQIRDALAAGGITVELITPPNATWAKVKAAADGANFFAYLGHGNGWPSPYVSNGEDSKDGLGLNPYAGDTNTNDV
jgi:hypothetical protein